MQAIDRDRLRTNRCGLGVAIKYVNAVVDKLVVCQVLTLFMEADIIEKPQTSFDRVRALLDILPWRGPKS